MSRRARRGRLGCGQGPDLKYSKKRYEHYQTTKKAMLWGAQEGLEGAGGPGKGVGEEAGWGWGRGEGRPWRSECQKTKIKRWLKTKKTV